MLSKLTAWIPKNLDFTDYDTWKQACIDSAKTSDVINALYGKKKEDYTTTISDETLRLIHQNLYQVSGIITQSSFGDPGLIQDNAEQMFGKETGEKLTPNEKRICKTIILLCKAPHDTPRSRLLSLVIAATLAVAGLSATAVFGSAFFGISLPLISAVISIAAFPPGALFIIAFAGLVFGIIGAVVVFNGIKQKRTYENPKSALTIVPEASTSHEDISSEDLTRSKEKAAEQPPMPALAPTPPPPPYTPPAVSLPAQPPAASPSVVPTDESQKEETHYPRSDESPQ